MIPILSINNGNLLYNGNFENIALFNDKIAPVGWYLHSSSIYVPKCVEDAASGKYSLETSMEYGSYVSNVRIQPGLYTAYAKFKQLEDDGVARLLMHVYDNLKNTFYQDVVFTQDYIINNTTWTECLITFDAPEYAYYLHFSPRSTDAKLVLVDDCKLARGEWDINYMRSLKPIIPILRQTQDINTVVGINYVIPL